jgi:signal transduction histidine kinase
VKIRQRLAIRFTIISGLLTGAILVFVYFVTSGFVHADFITRLNQQTELETLLFTKQTSGLTLDQINTFGLVQPAVVIYRDNKIILSRGRKDIPAAWLGNLHRKKSFSIDEGELSTVGMVHFINGKEHFVFVTAQDVYGQRKLNFELQTIIGGWLISLLLAYYAGLFFSRKALQPVTHVVNEVNKISVENLGHRVPFTKPGDTIEKPDEIDELILTFNDLLKRLEASFLTQKRFVQNASHELKTPLTAIMAEVELALTRARQPDEYQRTLSVVMQEAEKLEKTTHGLLVLTRLEERVDNSEKGVVELTGLVSEIVAGFRTRFPTRQIILQPSNQVILTYGNQLLITMAIQNIVDNALKYSNASVEVILFTKNDEGIVRVNDYGIGIPESDIDKIRTPLVRATNVGIISGSGLGLALVDRIMKVHHGGLEITSKEGEGTSCKIIFPLIQE